LQEPLGEYLIKKGKITEKQLSTALERQVTMGGRLGTNLIELGILPENDLTQILSKLFAIPSVLKEDLEKVDPAVIQLITKDAAQKYNIIPFKREKNSLSIAFLDRPMLEVLDELRFVTGCSIKPYITSELRFQYAMEKHYQISRQLRYISVLDEERKKYAEQAGTESGRPPAIDSSPEEMEATLQEALADWVEFRDRDTSIGIFLKAVSTVLDRGVLFVVKSGTASAWRIIPFHRQSDWSGFEFKLDAGGIFKEVIGSKTLFLGPVGPAAVHPSLKGLFESLGGDLPAEMLICPILINDQVVSFLYGDNQITGRPIRSKEFIGRLARKLGMILEILILKKKVLEL